jgi:uncharacterized protein YbaR (Trm112 family)
MCAKQEKAKSGQIYCKALKPCYPVKEVMKESQIKILKDKKQMELIFD